VLAGHIHRAQVLTHDLSGRPLGAPVIYPGSIERTSFAERDEVKGTYIVTANLSASKPVHHHFVPLPSRPMVQVTLDGRDGRGEQLLDRLRSELAKTDPQAVVQVRLEGPGAQEAANCLNAARLRELAPASMNISLSIPRANLTRKTTR
jgi:DNA repair exonuclease SbcCD nuclease subunit